MSHWISFCLVLLAVGSRAASVADGLTAAGVTEFTAAYQSWNAQRFAAAAGLFQHAATNPPPSAVAFYWLGTAHFHRMLQLRNMPGSSTNATEAESAMESALEALNRAVKLDPENSESHAMLGTLYGMKIDGNLFRAMRFGPRVEKHRAAAMKHGANDPRVRYLLGTCQFYTAKKPAERREALASFLTAEKLFLAERQRPAEPLEPRWGYASCLTFIGRTYESLGQRAEAADYFRRALEQQPTDHFASEGLARVTRKD